MRDRLETLALILATLVVAAFAVSFVMGVLRTSSTQPGIATGIPATRTTALEPPPTPRGRVEVLNAAGRGGLARRATDQLRRAGYDVVYFGNASSRRDSSLVLDRVGRLEIARGAGERLGIRAVRTDRDSTLLLDATVLLGADWAQAVARADSPKDESLRARVRRWLGAR